MSAGLAAKTSALLSLLFLVVYGGCNWITSLRGDVGTWYFEWERHIPFVPLMILPYMSIDAFFLTAPFLCRDEAELRTLARRSSFAIVAAGVCFLLFPLRFAFDRPEASGWLGAIFDAFRGLDQPFNLFPSLHITLRTILADLYVRRTAGVLRGATHVWFSLIGFSTVLTYQHHIVDVGAGFVLAAVCFYGFRESSPRLPVVANPRTGSYYALGSATALVLSMVTWPPWGGLFLWPAASLGIVAAAYFGLGPGIFRKTDGRLPLSARLVLGPYLLGQYLSLLYYRRQCRPWDQVTPGVLIGCRVTDREAAEAVRQGVTAVLDLTAEFSEAEPFLRVAYRNVPILDLTAPTLPQLREAAGFIREHAADGVVYVHCKIGYSRSAAAVGAYLMTTDRAASAGDVEVMLRAVRPSIVVRPEAAAALRVFQETSS